MNNTQEFYFDYFSNSIGELVWVCYEKLKDVSYTIFVDIPKKILAEIYIDLQNFKQGFSDVVEESFNYDGHEDGIVNFLKHSEEEVEDFLHDVKEDVEHAWEEIKEQVIEVSHDIAPSILEPLVDKKLNEVLDHEEFMHAVEDKTADILENLKHGVDGFVEKAHDNVSEVFPKTTLDALDKYIDDGVSVVFYGYSMDDTNELVEQHS